MQILFNILTKYFISLFVFVTALRFQVTQEDCDRSIDLSKENRVIIDYADSDFNVMIGVCIIYVTTSSPNEMICITSDSRTCPQSFSYHIGRYNPFGKVSVITDKKNRQCLNSIK